MKNLNYICGSATALIVAAHTIAAPIDLTIDPSQSTLDMSIMVDVSLANDTDSDSSTLSGTVEIELDDAGNPTSISINDMMVIMDQTMNFNWSFGFFGSADATMSNGTVSYATPGLPTGPVPVTAGSYNFPSVLVNLGGILDVNYDIFLAGSGSETVNLGDQGSFSSEFSGDIGIDGDQVTLSTVLPLNTTQPLVDADGNQLGTVTTTGTATIVAIGTAPGCEADINDDGELNFFDVSAFLSAFAMMDPVADFNNDGEFNFFDVSSFIASFSTGCP
ncbi:MAG: GC-type dockerin domain-anchored protein [Phycisphaerales bacterium]|nr:GC-type dockerin domain-anchored protein [Phycisphaerales bacterium]